MFADKSEELKASDQRRRDEAQLRIEAEAQRRAEEELRARATVSLVSFPSRIFPEYYRNACRSTLEEGTKLPRGPP